eukprot:jgi/Mesvir1/2098/Mv16630-RA.1
MASTPGKDNASTCPTNTLWVKHMPESLSKESLRRLFEHYSAVDVRICAPTGRLRNSVFVTFKDVGDAGRARAQLDRLPVLGKTLVAEFARPPPPVQDTTLTTTHPLRVLVRPDALGMARQLAGGSLGPPGQDFLPPGPRPPPLPFPRPPQPPQPPRMPAMPLYPPVQIRVGGSFSEASHAVAHAEFAAAQARAPLPLQGMPMAPAPPSQFLLGTPIAPGLGFDYPPDPNLMYAYPPINESIARNILNTIIAVPRLYTQVLHLLNKMNLPPPFGPATPTPEYPPPLPPLPLPPGAAPLGTGAGPTDAATLAMNGFRGAPDASATDGGDRKRKLGLEGPGSPAREESEESELSSTSSSSLSSDEGRPGGKGAEGQSGRGAGPARVAGGVPGGDEGGEEGDAEAKAAREARQWGIQDPLPPQEFTHALHRRAKKLQEREERRRKKARLAEEAALGPKASLALPKGVAGSSRHPPASIHVRKKLLQINVHKPGAAAATTSATAAAAAGGASGTSAATGGTAGGAATAPAGLAVLVADEEAIQRHRVSEEEMRDLPVFKNYDKGAPSPVLYLKNLHKSVTEDGLLQLFGRYFPSAEDAKQSLSVRLMTVNSKQHP